MPTTGCNQLAGDSHPNNHASDALPSLGGRASCGTVTWMFFGVGTPSVIITLHAVLLGAASPRGSGPPLRVSAGEQAYPD